jgi:hypothetical protein
MTGRSGRCWPTLGPRAAIAILERDTCRRFRAGAASEFLDRTGRLPQRPQGFWPLHPPRKFVAARPLKTECSGLGGAQSNSVPRP